MSALPPPLEGLGFEARGVCAAWFGMMRAGEGRLRFGMKELKPSAKAQACLDEIVAAGVARREEDADGAVAYVPLVDCSPLMQWLAERLGDPRLGFPLTEKVSPDSRERFFMEVSGTPEAVAAAKQPVRLVAKEQPRGK